MEEGACLHELGVDEEHDVSEDERHLKSSDLNPEDSSDSATISELIYTRNCVNLMKLRMDMRLKNSARQLKNVTLSCEIKSLRQTFQDSSRLVDELADIHRACADMDATIRSQANWIRKMKQENQALKTQIENNNWEKSMIIEDLIFCGEEHLVTIQELRTNNKDLEVQLVKAMVFGGPHMAEPISKTKNMEQLPHTSVEFSDVEDKEAGELQHSLGAIQEDPEGGGSRGGHVQTKSWWRRQASKLVKGMGNFRLQFTCCLGVRRVCKRNKVHPVNSDDL